MVKLTSLGSFKEGLERFNRLPCTSRWFRPWRRRRSSSNHSSPASSTLVAPGLVPRLHQLDGPRRAWSRPSPCRGRPPARGSPPWRAWSAWCLTQSLSPQYSWRNEQRCPRLALWPRPRKPLKGCPPACSLIMVPSGLGASGVQRMRQLGTWARKASFPFRMRLPASDSWTWRLRQQCCCKEG